MRWVRLHSYGSIWHMLNDSGTILCGRSMPQDAVESTEPRAPNSYICARCYRIERGIDPAPQYLIPQLDRFAVLEERLAAIEALLTRKGDDDGR